MNEPDEAKRPPRRWFAWRIGRRTTIAWGFIDQAFSSATNFGLSLLAGRMLGPSGLGQVFLAFSVYLFVLVVQRALVTETLLALTSAYDRQRRAETAGVGLTLSILVGILATLIAAVVGFALPGSGGTPLLLVAPWLCVTLVQDFWRSLLFRERRASAAAANDAIWFITMAASLPIAWVFRTEEAVMCVWGLGALGGAVAGFIQTRVRPSSIRGALSWWSREAWPFGRWNVAAAIVVNIGVSLWAFVLAAIVGAAALGGYRAVESLFAPLSLIGPAVALPGLPAIARAYAVGYRQARDVAVRLSGIAVAASLAFFSAFFLGGWHLLPLLYGSEFLRYRNLVVPIAIGQTLSAAAVGFSPLLKVQRRGRFLLLARVAALVLGIGLGALGAIRYGLIGAAWGGVIASFVSGAMLAIGALREPESNRKFGAPGAHPPGNGAEPTAEIELPGRQPPGP